MPRRNKPGFFQRMTGVVDLDDEDRQEPEEEEEEFEEEVDDNTAFWSTEEPTEEDEFYDEEGDLPVDMYETDSAIVIKTLIAGVPPQDLEISITRDSVTVRGERNTSEYIDENDYHEQELYWGPFSRSVNLPQEVDAENADATERYGLLTIHLPKIDKHKETKISVRTG